MSTKKEISAIVLTMLEKLNASLVAAGLSPPDSLKVQEALMRELPSYLDKIRSELKNPVEL